MPDAPTQVLRNLLRTRKQLVRERSSHVQRLQKTLEDANIKLDSAVTDIIGMTGRAMLAALIAGETDPGKLAAIADYRIKAPPARLREALRGRIMKHHRFLLRLHLQQIDAIDTAVAEIDREVNERIEPFRITVELLTTIPGIGELAARIIAAEIGNDMSRFATAAHLVSWAGLCPRNDESAGKRRSTRMRHGAPWLKTTLIQCSWAAARKKGSYIQAQFHRIRSRRGAKKAIGAVAASILTAIFHMLKNGTCYQDLGPDHFDRRAKTAHQTSGHQTSEPRLCRPDHPSGGMTAFCFLLALTASANSIRRRIASERDGWSFCCLAQLSMAVLSAAGSRSANTGLSPVRGRPRFFRNTGIDFRMILYYVKGEPVESGNFPPALTQANGGNHGPG